MRRDALACASGSYQKLGFPCPYESTATDLGTRAVGRVESISRISSTWPEIEIILTKGETLQSPFGRLFGSGTCRSQSDGELLGRFVEAGDALAFEALLARHGRLVLAVCRRWLKDPRDVEDAFQSVFVVLIRKAAGLRNRDHLDRWLRAVAEKVARRSWSKVWQRKKHEPSMLETDPIDRRSEDFESQEQSDLLWIEVNRLPTHYRLPVVLCHMEGRSCEEAAGVLECPVGTVKGRLSRARRLLRKRLNRSGLAAISPGESVLSIGSQAQGGLNALRTKTLDLARGCVAQTRSESFVLPISLDAIVQGVLKAMFISKIKAFAVAVVVVGSVAAGAGTAWRAAAAQRGAPGGLAGVPNAEAAQDPKKKEQDATPNQFSIDVPPLPKTPTPSDLLALRKALLKAAKTWVEVAEDQFDAGHITMNRYLDASMGLLDAELALAADQASRMAADRGHYDRLKRIVARATAEFEFGQRSIGDLAECQHALIKAEIRLCECQLEEVKK